jgi:hypothetical protein
VWRPHAAAYFKRARSENDKGIVGTEKNLEKADTSDEKELPKKRTRIRGIGRNVSRITRNTMALPRLKELTSTTPR